MAMAKLFRVPLLGVGTEAVESLASYVYRLARAHGVTVGQLIRFISENTGVPIRWSVDLKCNTVLALVRATPRNRRLLELLQESTGRNDLRCGTFHALTNCARIGDLYSKVLRWCPVCFSEAIDSGESPYHRLAWMLAGIKYCPQHRIRLIDRCPNCAMRPVLTRAPKRCDACPYCDSSLITAVKCEEIVESWCGVDSDLIPLLHCIGSDPNLEYPSYGVVCTLEQLEARGVSSRDWWGISKLKGSKLARSTSLRVARRIACEHSISLHGVLSGCIRDSTAPLDEAWAMGTLPELLPRPRIRRNRKRVRERFCRLLLQAQAREVPPSLQAVAKELEVSTGYLRYRYPAKVRKLLAERRRWSDAEKVRKETEARVAVMTLWAHHQKLGEQLSRKKALKLLRDRTGLPKFVLRREIEVCHRLHEAPLLID